MPYKIYIDPERVTFEELEPAAQVLLNGGLIAAPTQSFYALMAMVDNYQTLDRLNQLKVGRTSEQAFLILLDQHLRANCYAKEVPEEALGLMNKFWPGLMTLLFMAQPDLHSSLIGPSRAVGLRVEGLKAIRMLIRRIDRGLTGTSANPHGEKPPTTAEEVENYFGSKIDMIIDGGQTKGGLPSTIIDVSLGSPRLIRDGELPLNQLLAACPILRF